MLRVINTESCFRAVESKEVTRQDLHELHAGQAKTQTVFSLAVIHMQRMLMST